MKIALITGITGMDGSYLTELLLSKNYTIHGIIRRSSSFNSNRINHIFNNPKLNLHYGDLSDSNSINKIIQKTKPDEIYNLGAQSHVQVSFEIPEYTSDSVGIGNLRILESIKNINPSIKLYQASSSELFGSSPPPQNEKTLFQPRSPYAVAKLMAYWNTINYRDGYNIFATNGILFNHESPRRLETFVTKKITKGLVRILLGKQNILELGNLDAKRDWGYAPDYIELMYKLLQLNNPGDFVIGTGESYSIREFIKECLDNLNVEAKWIDSGLEEKLILTKQKNKLFDILPGKILIKINRKYYRPTEVNALQADISKIKKILNWKPKIKMKELAHIMIVNDLQSELNQKQEILFKNNFQWLLQP